MKLILAFDRFYRCPNLVLFNGEDLTPYRAASKNIMAVIARFGVLERYTVHMLSDLINIIRVDRLFTTYSFS
jgi:nucleotidyltransferase/DNA polymerase involved in DNA repair